MENKQSKMSDFENLILAFENCKICIGSKALLALKNIKYHNIFLQNCVSKTQSWNEKCLFSLYHPSLTSIYLNRNIKDQMTNFY